MTKSDKALNSATLELTQKLQMHFPRDIAPDVLKAWNGYSTDLLTECLAGVFGKMPTEQAPTIPEFKVFRTIKGGSRKSVEDFEKALEEDKYQIGTYATQILKKVAAPQVDTELDLVVVTVRDLGFTKNTRFDAICEMADSFGLEKCPAWVGPELRLQYADQPQGEWLVIAMEPLTVSVGRLRLFSVEHYSDDRRLNGNRGYTPAMSGASATVSSSFYLASRTWTLCTFVPWTFVLGQKN
jgi:hypothetical protein